MLYALTALTVALVAALLTERRRHDNLTRELVASLTTLVTSERGAYLTHIENLYQRIQAPEQAVYEHAVKQPVVEPVPDVRFDSDEDYWGAVESKEHLAERMLREELEAAISGDAE